MPSITYIEFDGTAHTVEANNGSSLMQTAVDNEVPGIDADCGGGCACATCHVYVEEAWIAKLNAADVMETSMLQLAEGVSFSHNVPVCSAMGNSTRVDSSRNSSTSPFRASNSIRILRPGNMLAAWISGCALVSFR